MQLNVSFDGPLRHFLYSLYPRMSLICALIWADKPPSKTSVLLFSNPYSIVKSLGPLFQSLTDPDNASVSNLSQILLKTTNDVVVETITNFLNQLSMLNLAGRY